MHYDFEYIFASENFHKIVHGRCLCFCSPAERRRIAYRRQRERIETDWSSSGKNELICVCRYYRMEVEGRQCSPISNRRVVAKSIRFRELQFTPLTTRSKKACIVQCTNKLLPTGVPDVLEVSFLLTAGILHQHIIAGWTFTLIAL